jgi:hypothetical protein
LGIYLINGLHWAILIGCFFTVTGTESMTVFIALGAILVTLANAAFSERKLHREG